VLNDLPLPDRIRINRILREPAAQITKSDWQVADIPLNGDTSSPHAIGGLVQAIRPSAPARDGRFACQAPKDSFGR
jgi:hypothetical protein